MHLISINLSALKTLLWRFIFSRNINDYSNACTYEEQCLSCPLLVCLEIYLFTALSAYLSSSTNFSLFHVQCSSTYWIWISEIRVRNDIDINTYFRYGLQAATSFKFVFKANGCPSIVPSHMISLMQPTASVVFASSKKRTVMIWFPFSRQLDSARDSACLTFSIMCFFVVPPCT